MQSRTQDTQRGLHLHLDLEHFGEAGEVAGVGWSAYTC